MPLIVVFATFCALALIAVAAVATAPLWLPYYRNHRAKANAKRALKRLTQNELRQLLAQNYQDVTFEQHSRSKRWMITLHYDPIIGFTRAPEFMLEIRVAATGMLLSEGYLPDTKLFADKLDATMVTLACSLLDSFCLPYKGRRSAGSNTKKAGAPAPTVHRA